MRAKVAKYVWRSGSRNGRLPTIGRPRGPGGDGYFCLFDLVNIHAYQKIAKMAEIIRSVRVTPSSLKKVF